jgi:hypothetical protein
MFGKAKGSPLSRRVPELELRAERLAEYEKWREPVKVDFQEVLGEADWIQYWSLHDAVVNDMKAAQEVANGLRKRVEDSLHAQRRSGEPEFLVKDENCEIGRAGGVP